MSDAPGAVSDGVVLITVHPAETVLPEEKIPDLEDGETVVVSSDPDEPFRMLATTQDWTEAMMAVQGEGEQE